MIEQYLLTSPAAAAAAAAARAETAPKTGAENGNHFFAECSEDGLRTASAAVAAAAVAAAG